MPDIGKKEAPCKLSLPTAGRKWLREFRQLLVNFSFFYNVDKLQRGKVDGKINIHALVCTAGVLRYITHHSDCSCTENWRDYSISNRNFGLPRHCSSRVSPSLPFNYNSNSMNYRVCGNSRCEYLPHKRCVRIRLCDASYYKILRAQD